MTALSLAPLVHHWPRERVIEYYREVSRMPVAVAYLGEVVCNKRGSMRLRDWQAVAGGLLEAGKEVVVSSKPLIESATELRFLERLAAQGLHVEVNDLALAGQLQGTPRFVAGPHLNLFNAPAFATLADLGAMRWVAPYEMDRVSFSRLLPQIAARAQTEVIVYGRLPIAFSTQCYTARSRGRTRSDCGHCCLDHPSGQQLESLDRQALMVVNGPQTLAHRVYSLMGTIQGLRRQGVSYLRIDPPVAEDAGRIVALFRAVLDESLDEIAALRELATLTPAPFCNGYWHGVDGARYISPIKEPRPVPLPMVFTKI